MKNLLKALLSSILISSFIFCWDKPFSKYNTYSINEDSTNKLEEVRVNGFKHIKSKYNWLEIGKETKKSYQSIL